MKKFLFILLCGFMLLGVTGCGETNKFVGLYRSYYDANGEQGYVYIEIKKDGTYTKSNYINSSLISKTEGDYEIGGNEIILYTNESHTSWLEFNYRSGNLANNRNNDYYERYDGTID